MDSPASKLAVAASTSAGTSAIEASASRAAARPGLGTPLPRPRPAPRDRWLRAPGALPRPCASARPRPCPPDRDRTAARSSSRSRTGPDASQTARLETLPARLQLRRTPVASGERIFEPRLLDVLLQDVEPARGSTPDPGSAVGPRAGRHRRADPAATRELPPRRGPAAASPAADLAGDARGREGQRRATRPDSSPACARVEARSARRVTTRECAAAARRRSVRDQPLGKDGPRNELHPPHAQDALRACAAFSAACAGRGHREPSASIQRKDPAHGSTSSAASPAGCSRSTESRGLAARACARSAGLPPGQGGRPSRRSDG